MMATDATGSHAPAWELAAELCYLPARLVIIILHGNQIGPVSAIGSKCPLYGIGNCKKSAKMYFVTSKKEVLMATVSFDKDFVVKDKESIKRIHQDLASPRQITVKKRDYKAENKRGVQLLKQQLSNLKIC